MSAPHRRRSGAMAFALSVVFTATGIISAPVTHAAGNGPTIRLVSGTDKVTLKRPPGRRAYLDIGAYVASVGGAFEVWASRPDYETPVSVWQIVRSGDTLTKYPLPSSVEHDWKGLSKFVHVVVTDADGKVVLDRFHAFCPGAGELARVNDDGPDLATYPQFCGGNPFTLGAVWGIDSGWASSALGYGTSDSIKGPDGRYTATLSIAPDYQTLFGVAPEDASVSIDVRVTTTKRTTCLPFCEGIPGGDARDTRALAGTPSAAVPIMTDPDPSVRPDLVALPAWGISINHQRRGNRDFLDFGATVWNKGPSPMVVEGFRRPGEPIMDGWEYFYANGEPVGRAPAGDLMYDARPGHQHWHFEQFARYSLLAQDQTQIVRSEKTGFCLAPTDAIDMTVSGALWNPYSIGLGTACGSRGSIWTREVLPTGWGDTYFQGLPGQSFDITDLPNGHYFIAVEANPDGLLIEGSTSNNIELREIVLRRKQGHRKVIVPPWHGIDTENNGGGNGGGGIPIPGPIPRPDR
ncbi:MAG: lysyl oxidase family protein [Actinomycetota bacterium]